MNRQIRAHDQLRQRNHMRRTTHILLHDPHTRTRLEIQPAGIECHPLPHKGKAWMGRVAPFQLHEAWLERRGPANRMHHWIVRLQKCIPDNCGEFRAETFCKV